MHGSYIPAEPVMLEENPAAGPESASEDGKTPAQSVPEHRFAVCVHGFADSSDGMGLYAAVYYDRYGMNVLLPDLRGHGRSDGDYVGMGYDDSRDILRWIDWILEKDPAAQIVLHGVSLGAAAVLMTTGYSLPKLRDFPRLRLFSREDPCIGTLPGISFSKARIIDMRSRLRILYYDGA
jgi:fermentation-respiration switch protein FrsA (DUF1100 family)